MFVNLYKPFDDSKREEVQHLEVQDELGYKDLHSGCGKVSSRIKHERCSVLRRWQSNNPALKKDIEKKYGGKWQVVIGRDMAVYFDETVIKDYIILQTEAKTMIIFRKKHIGLSKIEASSHMKSTMKKEKPPMV